MSAFSPLEKKPSCEKKKSNILYRFYQAARRQIKGRSLAGFTLIEVILVISIIAIVFVVGGRYTAYAVDVKKYQKSFDTMVAIRRALVGDERLLTLGVRAGFGYFERYATFPAAEAGSTVPTTALANYLDPLPSTTNYDPYKQDAWGNNFNYNPNVSVSYGATSFDSVRIICYGSDGAADSGGETIMQQDFQLVIRRNLYTDSLLEMNVCDAQGVILRDADGGGNYQLFLLRIYNQADAAQMDTVSTGVGELFYYEGLYSNRNEAGTTHNSSRLPVGFYTFMVGVEAAWRPSLSGNNAWVALMAPIYPKDPETPNVVQFRLPGEIDVTQF